MSTADAVTIGCIGGVVGFLVVMGLIKTVITIYETSWRVKEIEKDVSKLLRGRES